MNTETCENIGIKNIKISQEKPENIETDALIYPITQERLKSIKENPSTDFEKEMSAILKISFFKAELFEVDLVPNVHDGNPNNVLFLGLEKEEELDIEKIRKAFAAAIQHLKFSKVNNFTVMLPEVKQDKKELITATMEGTLLGDYIFDKYKTLEPKAEKIEFMTIIAEEEFKSIVEETTTVCNNVNLVRDWVNECGTIEHPEEIVEISKKIAKDNNLKITVIDKKEMKEKGLNLIYEVGKGSNYPPYIIFLEYNGNPDSKEKIALVGKGITFDSGGLNLKPSNAIKDMEKDMSGAATVLGIIKTASEIKLKKNILAVIGTAENMIGPDAYKPGDIIKSYNGLTVEVGNTDAEGRLVLGDALSYTVKNFKPNLIIDLATLTGAVISALGIHTIGMFGNTKENIQLLEKSGYRTYERVWNFPMFQEYKEDIKGDIADIRNIGPKGQAGSISAAVFLEPFVENTPWIHLDIAGVAFTDKPVGYLQKGGTGVGLRLLIDFLKK